VKRAHLTSANPTEQALEKKAAMIKKENAKFARKFSTPHTSMYTGVHESIDNILDPKYVTDLQRPVACGVRVTGVAQRATGGKGTYSER